MTDRVENWVPFQKYDVDEINQTNQQFFESRYSKDKSLTNVLRELFLKRYSYDIMDGTGPYLAIVLKVLSGPETKTYSHVAGLQSFDREISDQTGGKPKVRVIARVPRFDIDIPFPRDQEDKMLINIHAEFVERDNSPELKNIKEGSLIFVQYSNKSCTTGYNGLPSGAIIGLHSPAGFGFITKKSSAASPFAPPCAAARTLAGPGGGMYVGKTESNPNKFPGPLVAKIKSKIKTGMYGNGTAQTKEHFDESLRKSVASVDRIGGGGRYRGPAPDSKSSFIWIGTLKNNGYLDLLDRPISAGRETIIYAPMNLDLNSPIEIKYYFHDQGGFGRPWIHGPDTTLENAKQNAGMPGNDFREKIGPAIKALVRSRRNIILVIPELAHSKGFGTSHDDAARIQNLIQGKKVTAGSPEAYGLRTLVDPKVRPHVKEYLRTMPIEKNQNLLHITPLLERPYCNFDGSYSGGNFELFHQEVIEVLNEHLGKIDDKIEFISILADRWGAVSLASIVKAIPNSSVHYEAEKGFKNVNIQRIDFVTNDDLDTKALYFPVCPSYSIYSDYLLGLAPSMKYTEFNYITEKSQDFNTFFNKLGLASEFKKANKKGKSPGEFKFATPVGSAGSNTHVSLHICPKDTSDRAFKVGYAFSMNSDSLPSFKDYPVKGDANTSQKPSHDAVPDHALAIATKPAASDLARYQKQIDDTKPRIEFFENLLNLMVNIGQGDEPGICEEDDTPAEYKIYCSSNLLVTDEKSQFFADYLNYLEYKKLYMSTKKLKFYEEQLLPISNNKAALENFMKDFQPELEILKLGGGSPLKLAKEQWATLKTSFKIENFATPAFGSASIGGKVDTGAIATIAEWIGLEEALQIENAIKNVKPEKLGKNNDCVPPPVSLREIMGPPSVSPSASKSPAVISCKDSKITAPNNYEQLTRMIPYFPSKDDFSSFAASRISTKKANMEDVPGYEVDTFKYKARTVGDAIVYHKSPPIWSCLAEKIETDWELACNESSYVPFKVVSGIKGSFKQKGVTAYKEGLSLHSLGLAFDLDPYITGYSANGEPLYSVYTGAWTPGFIEQHGEELYSLGVFKEAGRVGIPLLGIKVVSSRWDNFLDNAYDGANRLRTAENWDGANNAYKNKKVKKKYDKIMKAAKGAPIVPYGANPVQWLLSFCEKSGMKWGNSTFLKKRWRGGQAWTQQEQKRIASIYSIPDIVPRIYSISWGNTRFDDHMHFQYYGTASTLGVISWKEIEKVKKKLGK